MRLKTALLSTAAVAVIGSAGLVGLGNAARAESPIAGNGIVDKLVSRFGLNKDEVAAVFNEEHESRQAERAAAMSEKLQLLVNEGKLTSEQKTAVEAKHEEMRAKHEALRASNATRDEMKAQMETMRDELESWADQQGIDLDSFMMFGRGQGHGRGMRGHDE